jgi:hypothetical protein
VALEDDLHASTRDTAMRVVDAAYEGGARGILWTGGGEPTIWRPLLDMLGYAGALGMTNALYTNGFVLGRDADYVDRLLDPACGLAFVRVSINAVTPRIVKLHWGVEASEVAPQLDGLARLLEVRNRHETLNADRVLPSIQVSTIIDRQNVADLMAVCETVAEIFRRHRRAQGAEDRFIVRPLTYHGRPQYSFHDHSQSVIDQIIEVCGHHGPGRRVLSDAGVDAFLGFGLDAVAARTVPSYSDLIKATYAARDLSLAAGLFLIIGPNGAVHISTEHNCDANWSFGDLRVETVDKIYRGERRRQLLEYVNANRWGPNVAQATSRTARLDRIATAVRAGVLSDEDIADIGLVARGSHRLILD